MKGSYAQIKFSKELEVVSDKNPFFVIGLFCAPHSICLKIGFGHGGLIWKSFTFICSTLN